MRFVLPISVISRTPKNKSIVFWEASKFPYYKMKEIGENITTLAGYWALKNKGDELSEWQNVGLWVMPEKELVEDSKVSRAEGVTIWDSSFLSYIPEEQERMVDTAIAKYEEVFGEIPECVGSYHFPPEVINHLEGYGVKVAIGYCWEQSLAGLTNIGSPLFPYYPSKRNSLRPVKSRDILLVGYASRDPIHGYLIDPTSFSSCVDDIYDRRPGHRDPIATPEDMGYLNRLYAGYMEQERWNRYTYFMLINETDVFDIGYRSAVAGVNREIFSEQVEYIKKANGNFTQLAEFARQVKENCKDMVSRIVWRDILDEKGRVMWYSDTAMRVCIFLDTMSIWDIRNYALELPYGPRYSAVLDKRENRYLLCEKNFEFITNEKDRIELKEGTVSFREGALEIDMEIEYRPIGIRIRKIKGGLVLDSGWTFAFLEDAEYSNGMIKGPFVLKCMESVEF